jgi:RecB family exonuclease
MQLTVNLDDQAMQVLSIEGAMCGGYCGDEPGDRNCPDCERCRRDYLAALRKAGWAPRAEIQQQLDQAQTELAAIKKQLAGLTVRAGGPR